VAESTLIELANALLEWQEGAHEVLGDWLEDRGFGRRFHQQGRLYWKSGVACALLQIGALEPDDVFKLRLNSREKFDTFQRFADYLAKSNQRSALLADAMARLDSEPD